MPVIVVQWMPHYWFCVYDGADAGTLVGAEFVSDIDEFCNDTSSVTIGGQVPTTCWSEINAQFGTDASVATTCDGGALPDSGQGD